MLPNPLATLSRAQAVTRHISTFLNFGKARFCTNAHMENPMNIKASELETALASVALSWTAADDAAAAKEGWNVYPVYVEHLMEIEVDDTPEPGQLVEGAPVLDDDGDAFAYVTVLAYRRSELHMKALAIHNFYAKDIAAIREALGHTVYVAPMPSEEVLTLAQHAGTKH